MSSLRAVLCVCSVVSVHSFQAWEELEKGKGGPPADTVKGRHQRSGWTIVSGWGGMTFQNSIS